MSMTPTSPKAAAKILDLHIQIVNPVNLVQLSVDHRLRYHADRGVFKHVNVEGFSFYQTGLRELSDNQWNWPEKLGKTIHYPPT